LDTERYSSRRGDYRCGESKMEPTISLCMIVRDEAAALPDCLARAVPQVDEVIVVDTGSQDNTVAIAQSYQAQIHHFPWQDDFAAARNAALHHATGDWVLVLDADEWLLPAALPSLRTLIQRPEVLVVNLLRQEVGAQQSPYSLVSRLFRRRPDIYFQRPYHELIDDSVLAILQREPGWVVVDLPTVAIAHTGYQATAIAQRHKAERAERIMARYLAQHPQDAYIANKLGALYADTGNLALAQPLLEQALQSPRLEPPLRYELHYHLASVHATLANALQAEPGLDPETLQRAIAHLETAATHCQAALDQPILPTLKLGTYILWGNLALALDHSAAAQDLYEAAVAIDPTLAMGHYNLGLARRAQGNWAGAIAAYERAIAVNPTYAEAYQNLGVALLKRGQVAESGAAFQRAIALYGQAGDVAGERLRQSLQDMGLL
jgi:tetratricopeptide (TPR) repeat protein